MQGRSRGPPSDSDTRWTFFFLMLPPHSLDHPFNFIPGHSFPMNKHAQIVMAMRTADFKVIELKTVLRARTCI